MLITYDDNGPRVGVVDGDRVVPVDDSGPAADRVGMLQLIEEWDRWRDVVAAARATAHAGHRTALAQTRLYAPIPEPRRNPYLIAGNYLSHVQAGEAATGVPLSQRKTAIFFTKPTTSVTGPNDDIEYDPALTSMLDYEAELVVVIGRRGRGISRAEAMDHVFGYTIGNDVSARDVQVVKPTPDFLRGKGMDTFLPLGPGIVLRDDVGDYRKLRLTLSVNGEQQQDATLDQLIRDIPEMIETLSAGITLLPGDLIATGTPSGVQIEKAEPRWLRDGDLVVSEIDLLGRLANVVRARTNR